ncbi:MAG: hypothetical protein HYU69_02645 [Bacteroidetes bacterium]|nr:hypothetical protein [Bacteroidota bacterium]
MKELRTTTSILILILLKSALAMAQFGVSVSNGTSKDWIRNDIFQDKVFIENKGQFNNKNNLTSTSIKYGINSNGLQVYFTNDGLTYRYDRTDQPDKTGRDNIKFTSHAEEENYEKEMVRKTVSHSHFVHLQWLNANPHAQITAQDIVPEYYTYGDEKKSYKASAFKKIIYKNLYPGIDLEYIFHKKEGLKYSLTLHPGADASKIQMKYTGAEKIYKDKSGNIHLSTSIGDIIDHAPFTFYHSDMSVIGSDFETENNIVTFKLNNYNKKNTVIIDPWTTGVALPGPNKALEVEKDKAGNVYILGGTGGGLGNFFRVKKFSSAGALIWTYVPTPTCGYDWRGCYGDDLKIDQKGDVYISGGGLCGSPFFKVSSAGALIWSSSGIRNDEPYRILFDCDNTILYATGYNGAPEQIFNPLTGVYQYSVGGYPIIGQTSEDMRDCIRAPNGNYYGVTAEQGNTARIRAFGPGWGNLWNTSGGFNITYWSGSYTNVAYPVSLHLIAASKQFLFVSNGAILQKRNITNGALINTVTIPGGTAITSASGNSGIVTDTCGNVYVSSQNAVYKYDPNLTFLASAATSAAIYDICLGNFGEILACGNGFLASVNLSACTLDPLDVTATATPTGNCTNGNIGTATASISGGMSSYSYYWIPGGQTTPSISGLAAGTYSVIVTDVNCNKDTAVVTVTSTGALTTSVTKTNLLCYGANNGSATISVLSGTSPYTYSWSNGSTTSTATGLGAGTYTATITDAGSCTSIVAVNISQPPQIPVSVSSTGTSCNNANGSATASANGSTGPYTYSWSNGTKSTYSCCLSADTYTVTVTGANGCTQTSTATIAPSTSPVDPSFTQSPNGTVCIGSNVNFTNTGTPPGTGITYNWLISNITPANVSGTTTNFSYAFLTVGTYTVTHSVNDGTCNTSIKSTITVINCTGPSVTATGNSVCPGSCGTVTSSTVGGTGPYTYLWSTGGTTQNINPCPAATTTYTVTITDNTGATATSTAIVTINPVVTVTVNATNLTCNGSNDGSAQASGSSGTSPFTYNWSNVAPGSGFQVSGLSAGTYSVTVTDNKGCTGTSSVTIAAPPALSGQFAKGTANCAGCGCKEWLMINGSGGTRPYSYSWPDGYVNGYKNQLCPGFEAMSSLNKKWV